VPERVRIQEVGIGGIHLVQTLLEEPYDALIIVDCVDRGRPPGR
jgi:hydrogenase maturation protease